MAMKAKEEPRGNASDIALIKFFDEFEPIDFVRQRYEILFESPFNSKTKFAAMVVQRLQPTPGQGEFALLLKGAPEIVLPWCTMYASQRVDERDMPMNDRFKDKFEEVYKQFGSLGAWPFLHVFPHSYFSP